MTARNHRLDRLVIQSPCPTSWEAMQGGDGARFCPHCNRHVHDLAALEARELEILIQATGGRFCSRIPRAAGPLIPVEPLPTLARRASPVAAAVVGALVGLAGAAWTEAPPAAPAQTAPADAGSPRRPDQPRKAGPAGAVLTGTATEGDSWLPGVEVVARGGGREFTATTTANGSFVLTGLPAGVYEIEARLEGFAFSPETVRLRPGERRQLDLAGKATSYDLGVTVVLEEIPLRRAFQDSSLVVIATVRSSAWTEDGRIRTELAAADVFKGNPGTREVTADHNPPLALGVDPLLPPGTTVLAFLREGPDGIATATDPNSGLRQLSPAALAAYRRRLSALAALGRIVPEPEEVAEWLVATAEDPHTRSEAVRELTEVLATATALARRQAEPGTPESEARDSWIARTETARIGAAVTPAHRDRLLRALLATENGTAADLDLYELLRPQAGDEATRWLRRQLQQTQAPDWLAHRTMTLLAEALDDPDLRRLVREADREIARLTHKAEPDVHERIAEVEGILREEFERVLKPR